MSQEPNNIDKKRIAKNTIFLFVRMIIVIGVGFFTVRLVLKQLGVEHYGVYSLITGFIGLFCIASQGMATMLQRYLCYEAGLKNESKLPQIFTIGMLLTAVYALLLFFFGETVGMWLLVNKLKITADILQDAKLAYHFILLTTLMQVFIIPYTSAIISYEQMSFFAKISLAEAVCKFISVLILIYQNGNLINYALYIFITTFLILCGYAWYCHKHIPACRFVKTKTGGLLRDMASFTSWNVLESSGNLIRANGSGLVLNAFCSIAYNATWNVSGYIRNIMAMLYNNLLGAAAPQILKSYTAEDKTPFYDLICATARYAFILMWLISYPILLKTELLLKLWLGENFPPSIVLFSQFNIIFSLISSLFCSLWVAAQANGKVARYQIEFFILCIITLLLVYGVMTAGAPAIAVAVVFTISNVANLIIRLLYLIRTYQFPCKMYLARVLFPAAALVVCSCVIGFGANYLIRRTVWNIIAAAFSTAVINPLLAVFMAISADERAFLVKKVKEYVHMRKGKNYGS